MLVLTRKLGQAIVIGDSIEIAIVEIKGDQVRLGITAPKDIAIHRKEVYEQVLQENKQAAMADLESSDQIMEILSETTQKKNNQV
jgi:carbon storage regulator